MTTIYTLDAQNVFVAAIQVDPMAKLPRCTLTPPPDVTAPTVAQWGGDAWAVLDAYPVPLLDRIAAGKAIDAAVLAIYDKPTTLGDEYKAREADAVTYKAAGYTGTVPARVAGFATPAGMTATAATDLILSQAAQMRGALAQLADLRMQKYAVTRASTEAAAQAAYTATMTAIAAIAAALG